MPEEDEPTVSPEDCDHNSNANEWQPVLGQLKETTECSKCGAIIQRDITFVLLFLI